MTNVNRGHGVGCHCDMCVWLGSGIAHGLPEELRKAKERVEAVNEKLHEASMQQRAQHITQISVASALSGAATAAETILQEAQRLTHGPRRQDYGHPLDDYTKVAGLVNILLDDKLTRPLDPEDIVTIQRMVKESRQAHRRKRDNLVDIAGYAWVDQACTDERALRAGNKTQAVGKLDTLNTSKLGDLA